MILMIKLLLRVPSMMLPLVIFYMGFYSQYYYYSGSTADDTAIRTTVMQDFTADKSSKKAM